MVIPCYNYGRYLPDAVASALDQEGVDVDVLIVDDCSTDDSAAIAEGLAADDARVRVLLHDANRGHIATYNHGLAEVTGTYVALLSADDVLTADSLSRAAALMEARPEVGLVYGRVCDFSDEAPGAGTARESWSVWTGRAWLAHIARRGRNIIVNPEAVMRTTLLRQLGGYAADHPHAADLLLWMRAAALMDVGRVNGPVQAGYRVHGENMHSTVFAGAVKDLGDVRRAFAAFFEEHPNPAMEQTCLRHLAREALLVAISRQADGRPSHDLEDLAREIDATVTRSGLWRRYQRRRLRVTPLEARATRMVHDMRWRLRWQRWWRLGT